MTIPPLHALPTPLRVTLTAFLAMIAAGYGFALLNIYHRHAGADGAPGLTLDDLRAVYAGVDRSRSEMSVVPSRMLRMIEGSMRQYVADDADYAILHEWLANGAASAELDRKQGNRSPRRVLALNCLRCHATDSDSEISKRAPFGPDQLTIDEAQIARFTATTTTNAAGEIRIGPQDAGHLILITHAHMLSIPLFTLVVGALFWLTPAPPRLRALIMPVPMCALMVDFAGWWLARAAGGFVWFIVAAGAAFGVAFGLQLLAVVVALWRVPPRGS